MKNEDFWDDPDENYPETDRAASYPAAAGAPAAGEAEARGGFPLRGLAMILIGVAVLLALWGVYAMLNGDGKDAEPGAPASSASASAPAQPGSSQPAAPSSAAAPAPAEGQEEEGQPAPAEQQDSPAAESPAAESPAPAAPAEQGAPAQDGDVTSRVVVLNNSMVPNLAENTANDLRADGMTVENTGNLPGETAVLQQNTAYFDPANPAAERQARELAERFHGVAVPYADSPLPEDQRKPSDVTLVLMQG